MQDHLFQLFSAIFNILALVSCLLTGDKNAAVGSEPIGEFRKKPVASPKRDTCTRRYVPSKNGFAIDFIDVLPTRTAAASKADFELFVRNFHSVADY